MLVKKRRYGVLMISHNGLAMYRKSIAELLIKQRFFIAFIVYESLL